jgi:formylglycine-generating enzyme required for sulfatase activity
VEVKERAAGVAAVGDDGEEMEVQGIRLRLIPAGEFLMGSPDSDPNAQPREKPHHAVRITKPFYLGVYPVTQSQYEAVMGSNPSHFRGDGNRPVEKVSWHDAQAFCGKLTELAGEQSGGLVFRLPTEAEWEYACRAGTSTRYSFGDDVAQLGEYAWFKENAERTTHPVGQKKANAWGLYDMHGNVFEWCQDPFDDNYYASSPSEDPRGPQQASRRVIQGGSWCSVARCCRAAFRHADRPAYRYFYLGFRVAAVPPGE